MSIEFNDDKRSIEDTWEDGSLLHSYAAVRKSGAYIKKQSIEAFSPLWVNHIYKNYGINFSKSKKKRFFAEKLSPLGDGVPGVVIHSGGSYSGWNLKERLIGLKFYSREDLCEYEVMDFKGGLRYHSALDYEGGRRAFSPLWVDFPGDVMVFSIKKVKEGTDIMESESGEETPLTLEEFVDLNEIGVMIKRKLRDDGVLASKDEFYLHMLEEMYDFRDLRKRKGKNHWRPTMEIKTKKHEYATKKILEEAQRIELKNAEMACVLKAAKVFGYDYMRKDKGEELTEKIKDFFKNILNDGRITPQV